MGSKVFKTVGNNIILIAVMNIYIVIQPIACVLYILDTRYTYGDINEYIKCTIVSDIRNIG